MSITLGTKTHTFTTSIHRCSCVDINTSFKYLELVGATSQDDLYYEIDTNTEEPSTDSSGNYKLERALLPTKFNFNYYKGNIIDECRLLFKGIERFTSFDTMYFEHVQPLQHGSNIDKKGVFFYSFALDPTKYQPSGACNMSREKNVQLDLTTNEVYSQESTNETLQ